MGILIIHADNDVTPAEWQQIRDTLSPLFKHAYRQVEAATSPEPTSQPDVAYQQRQQAIEQRDERLHDPQGEYDDATWQSFSPQKRGSIKRHRNGNDAPFVAQSTPAPQPAATPVSDEMAALFAASGIAVPESAQPTPQPEPTPQPAAQPAAVKAVMPESAASLTPGERSDLTIWGTEKLQDPNKQKIVKAYLGGAVTLAQTHLYVTKGGKSTLAKDMARVAKRSLPAYVSA